jgi:flagellar biosynthesis protein FliQ
LLAALFFADDPPKSRHNRRSVEHGGQPERAYVNLTAFSIESLQLALWLGAPVLGACALSAILMSLVSALLQASEPTFGFVPKWLAAALALWLSRGFVWDGLTGFAARVLGALVQLGHGL